MFFAESQGSVPLKQGSPNAGLHRTERVLYFPQMFEKGKVEGSDEAAKLQLLRPNWKESLPSRAYLISLILVSRTE